MRAKTGPKKLAGEREPNGRLRRCAGKGGPASVYMITSVGNQWTKVGVATDPAQRLAILQTSSERDLYIRGVMRVPTKQYAQGLERYLHTFLRAEGRHLRGEWFEIWEYEIDLFCDAFHTGGVEALKKVHLADKKVA